MIDTSLERAIIAQAILESPATQALIRLLKEDDFTDHETVTIYHAIKRLIKSGASVDLLTVTSELRKTGELQSIGGSFALTKLTDEVSSVAHIETHCKHLRLLTMQRKAYEIGSKLQEDSNSAGPELLQKIISQLSDLLGQLKNDEVKIMSHYASNVFNNYIQAKSMGGRLLGLDTGFDALNRATGGIKGLAYLAARPAMGKTSLALSIAQNLAKQNKAVYFLSLETSGEQLTVRQMSAMAEVDGNLIQRGLGDEYIESKLKQSMYDMADLKIYVEVRGTITPSELRARAKQMMDEFQVELIIVDFVGLMSPEVKSNSRENDIGNISRGLKLITQELGIPVLALSQLSRAVESRSDRRPNLSDLRDSGSLEQDADQVIFIMRPEYYSMDEFQTADGNVVGTSGLAVVDIAKNKFGKTGESLIKFIPQYTCFQEFESLNWEV